MATHNSVKKSFFIRFLLVTVIIGNIYICLQSLFHSFNFHFLDLYLRWYAFNVTPAYNIGLLFGTLVTLYGALLIWNNGISGYKMYLSGKGIVLIGYIFLTLIEYSEAKLPYPWLLIPVLVAIEGLYPLIIYISLRKSMAKRSY